MRSILLPGTLCDARVFGGIVPALADPDVLDIGGFNDAREAAHALLPAVPAGSLGIAFSLGGWILLEMARLAPDRFTALLLLSANAHPDDPANAAGRLARVDQGRSGLDRLTDGEWPQAVGGSAAGDPAIKALIADMAVACGHDVHARQARLNIARPDHRTALGQLPVPVHLIAGAEDRLCPVERYRAMAAAGVTLHMLPGIGHFVPLEAPDAVVAVLRDHVPEALA